MAAAMRGAAWHDPEAEALESARARAMHPVGQPPGDIESIREALYQVMWDDVGILRDAAGLARARARLLELGQSLDRSGVSGSDLRYNLTWHDWLNLESLITVSLAICSAAEARTESRGAHFREDFPETGDLATSAFSCVSLRPGTREFGVAWKPVRFTRVQPGQSLLAA
jgi:fumarate reductase flavoprotein subunit